MQEFQRDRGKKVRHSVCRNDIGCAEANRRGPEQAEHGEGIFFVDRAIEDASFILERIDARWPEIGFWSGNLG